MTKVDKILQGVPFWPKKVLVWQIAKDVSQSEIINRAKALGYIIDTRGDTRISRSNVTPQVLIFKNQYPYKSVNSLDEASCETKVPKATILRMIASPLSKEDKRIGGKTTPAGWGFDWLA